jgi:hypothetical protein
MNEKLPRYIIKSENHLGKKEYRISLNGTLLPVAYESIKMAENAFREDMIDNLIYSIIREGVKVPCSVNFASVLFYRVGITTDKLYDILYSDPYEKRGE